MKLRKILTSAFALCALLLLAGAAPAAHHEKGEENPCGEETANPCNPCGGEEANPCNPCGGDDANPCDGHDHE